MKHPFSNPDVEAVFDGFNDSARPILMALRDMIFATAAADPRTGKVQEALRWGQPAYLTPETKSGTTIRLGVSNKGECALFVHCRTTLISDFTIMFPGMDRNEGNRAVLFESPSAIDPERHGWLIHRALTYHL